MQWLNGLYKKMGLKCLARKEEDLFYEDPMCKTFLARLNEECKWPEYSGFWTRDIFNHCYLLVPLDKDFNVVPTAKAAWILTVIYRNTFVSMIKASYSPLATTIMLKVINGIMSTSRDSKELLERLKHVLVLTGGGSDPSTRITTLHYAYKRLGEREYVDWIKHYTYLTHVPYAKVKG